MQFDVENVKALCLGCHIYWWHKHPLEAGKWIETAIDKDRLARLKKKANTINKEPVVYKDMKQDLENKIKEFKNENK
jgi:hypothetical protein